MHTLQKKLFPFLKKPIKKGKVNFSEQGVIIVEGKLENLLLLIEFLKEKGITVKDRLGSEYLKEGCIPSKIVELRISGRIAQIFPHIPRKRE